MITPVGCTVEEFTAAIRAGSELLAYLDFPKDRTSGGSIIRQSIDKDSISLEGITINDVLNGDTNLRFGKSVMKEITVTLLKDALPFTPNWTDEFILRLGVIINNVPYAAYCGHFTGTKPDETQYTETITLVAYDRMKKFDIDADPIIRSIGLTTMSLNNFITLMCYKVGVTYSVSNDMIPSTKNRIINTESLVGKGYTCRDIIALAGEACGCYAYITNNGTLKYKWFTEQDYTIDADHEFSVKTGDINEGKTWDDASTDKWEDYYDAVNTWDSLGGYHISYATSGLLVKNAENDSGVFYGTTSGNQYVIVSNPFLITKTVQEANTYIKPLYDRLVAFGGYQPMTVDTIGNWLVESGDIVQVDVHGEYFKLPIFARTLQWDGGCVDTYEATGEISKEVYSSDIKQKLQDLGKYDKQSGIRIDSDGIEVIGNKTVAIRSGGTFDVDATNFKINSTDKKMVCGNWTFDDNGETYSDPDYGDFEIRPIDAQGNNITAGIYFRLQRTVSPYPSQGEICFAAKVGNVLYDLIYGFIQNESGTWINTLYSSNGFNIGYKGNTVKRLYVNQLWTDYDDSSFVMELGFKHSATSHTNRNSITFDGKEGSMPSIIPDGAGMNYAYGTLGSAGQRWDVYAANVNYKTLTQDSSRNVKHDIDEIRDTGEIIDKLNPVSFVYNDDQERKKRYGLIYEDTVDILPEICTCDDGNKGIDYAALVPVLLKEIQDLRKRVAKLETLCQYGKI